MIDFPASPTAGQLFVAPNGVTYQWSSTYTAWLPLAVTSAGVGDFSAIYFGSGLPATLTTLIFPTVVSGNVGGWYSTSTGRYTPPAGRFFMYSGITGGYSAGATQLIIQLRKNGSVMASASGSATTGQANFVAEPTILYQADANGTDWFDVQVQSTSAASNVSGNCWFGAFPISAAGPAAGTGSSWRQIARVVPTAGQATIDLQNVPADINDLELRFDLAATATGSG